MSHMRRGTSTVPRWEIEMFLSEIYVDAWRSWVAGGLVEARRGGDVCSVPLRLG
jgi:hypothetical protein